MATLQEKFALLQQMKKEKELKEARAKETKRFDIFTIAGVALPIAAGSSSNNINNSNSVGPRSSSSSGQGQGPGGGVKTGQGGTGFGRGGGGGNPSYTRPLSTTTAAITATTTTNNTTTNNSLANIGGKQRPRPEPLSPVARTTSSTSLKRRNSEVNTANNNNAPRRTSATVIPESTASSHTTSNKSPQVLLSPTHSPAGVDTDQNQRRNTPEMDAGTPTATGTTSSAPPSSSSTSSTSSSAVAVAAADNKGGQECPPKKLKRSSMAVRNERQAIERRNSSASSMDFVSEGNNRLGSPPSSARETRETDRKYSTDQANSPGGDTSSVASMPLTPTPSPLRVEDVRVSIKEGIMCSRPDLAELRDSGFGHLGHALHYNHHSLGPLQQLTEGGGPLNGRYRFQQDTTSRAGGGGGGYERGSQSPTRSGSMSPSRSRSRSPMVMSPPPRKPSFSSSMSMSPPHTLTLSQMGSGGPPPRTKTPAPPRVIHQLPPRPRSPKLPPEGSGVGTVRPMAGALVSAQALDPRIAAAAAAGRGGSSNNVRRQILSYDDL
ncbi:hypothetical protein BG004_002739 [Podila humilis]|nr:hypothetical protein BG004_002739 [Podila humilis]